MNVGPASTPTNCESSDGERQITVGRHRVSVSIQGTEYRTVPLLMCNGVGAEYRLWQNLRKHLQCTTVAFDVQGPYMGRRPSMRAYAAFLNSVAEQLEFDCVDVLGLSWGGIAAQQLAHDHPQRVRRMILASSSPGLMSVPAKPSSAIGLVTPHRDASKIDELVTKLYAGDFLTETDLVARLGLVRPIDESTYRRQMVALFGWSSVPWLRKLCQETLILHGDDDPVVPVSNARLVSWLMPNASLEIIPNGGHLFLYTRPEVIGRQITEFLKKPTRQGLAPQPGHRRESPRRPHMCRRGTRQLCEACASFGARALNPLVRSARWRSVRG